MQKWDLRNRSISGGTILVNFENLLFVYFGDGLTDSLNGFLGAVCLEIVSMLDYRGVGLFPVIGASWDVLTSQTMTQECLLEYFRAIFSDKNN